MLVLSLKATDKVYIGDYEVIILKGRARIGVVAPKEVPVVREKARKEEQHGKSAK